MVRKYLWLVFLALEFSKLKQYSIWFANYSEVEGGEAIRMPRIPKRFKNHHTTDFETPIAWLVAVASTVGMTAPSTSVSCVL